MRLLPLFSFFLSVLTAPLSAQPGCTDPLATNFDPNATFNDGSCVYANTNYSLTVKTDLSTTLNETSGLVMANGNLWTHNDSGNDPKIYKIDTLTNSILQTVTIGGATNVDWEDITFDGSNFYIGDFGNNSNGNRTNLKIYKFPIAAIPSGSNVTVSAAQVSVINFSYEDQTNFDPMGSNNTDFDCESIIYVDGALHLFTKQWISKNSAHYTLPTTAGTYEAVNLETFDVNGLVTAADISPFGVIMLLGYESAGGTPFFWILWDYPSGEFFGGNKRRINLGSFFSVGQIEGICFRGTSYGYVSNEKFSVFVPARLYSYQISQWLQPLFFPVELVGFAAALHLQGVLLEWETASEQNNAGFFVERSEDGQAFRQIGFVPGSGNSQTRQQYNFYDSEPGNTRYYRLRQSDWNGSAYFSPIVSYSPNTAISPCRFGPNPVLAGQMVLVFNDITPNASAVVWNASGQNLWSGKQQDGILPVLVPGLYLLQVYDGQGLSVCYSRLMVK